MPDAPLSERLAMMASVAKSSEARAQSVVTQATPMTGEQPAPDMGSRSRTGVLFVLLAAVGGAALVYTDQLDVQVTPKGDLNEIAEQIAPRLAAPEGAPAVPGEAEHVAPGLPPVNEEALGGTGLPIKLEHHLEDLVQAESRAERVAGAEALLAHMPMDEVPTYVRVVAHLQLEASCSSKKEQLLKLIELNDPRALPALVMTSQRAKNGCGAAGRDCLKCMRDEIDELIGKFENAQMPEQVAPPAVGGD